MMFPTTIVFGTGSGDPSGSTAGGKKKPRKTGKKKKAPKK